MSKKKTQKVELTRTQLAVIIDALMVVYGIVIEHITMDEVSQIINDKRSQFFKNIESVKAENNEQ